RARRMPWGVALDAKVPWQRLRGRFGAAIEIHIPRHCNLEVRTGGGNIEVQDIGGRVRLTSAGGNIKVGGVGKWDDSGGAPREAIRDQRDKRKPVLPVSANIQTQGGNITVGD